MSEFEPLPSGPEKVVLDHDRDSTMISHDESLEMENIWAMKFCEAPTLEFIEKDSVDEHGSFILVIPQESCSFNTSPELSTLCAPSTHEDYNHVMVFSANDLVVTAQLYPSSKITPIKLPLTFIICLYCFFRLLLILFGATPLSF